MDFTRRHPLTEQLFGPSRIRTNPLASTRVKRAATTGATYFDEAMAEIQREKAAARAAPPDDYGLLDDTFGSFAKGGIGGIKALVDLFGADSGVSQSLGKDIDYWRGRVSPERKAELARQEAEKAALGEDASFLDRGALTFKQLARNPLQTAAEAFGNIAPLGVVGRGARAVGLGARAAAGGLGTAMGAGAVKGSIYDTTLQGLTSQGVPLEEAMSRAAEAQSYAENPGKIALGAGVGALTARLGVDEAIIGAAMGKRAAGRALTDVESAALKGALQKQAADFSVKGGVRGILKEGLSEGPQEAIETGLGNLGGIDAGVRMDPWDNVIEAGVQGGVMGAIAGAPGQVAGGYRARQDLRDLQGNPAPSELSIDPTQETGLPDDFASALSGTGFDRSISPPTTTFDPTVAAFVLQSEAEGKDGLHALQEAGLSEAEAKAAMAEVQKQHGPKSQRMATTKAKINAETVDAKTDAKRRSTIAELVEKEYEARIAREVASRPTFEDAAASFEADPLARTKVGTPEDVEQYLSEAPQAVAQTETENEIAQRQAEDDYYADLLKQADGEAKVVTELRKRDPNLGVRSALKKKNELKEKILASLGTDPHPGYVALIEKVTGKTPEDAEAILKKERVAEFLRPGILARAGVAVAAPKPPSPSNGVYVADDVAPEAPRGVAGLLEAPAEQAQTVRERFTVQPELKDRIGKAVSPQAAYDDLLTHGRWPADMADEAVSLVWREKDPTYQSRDQWMKDRSERWNAERAKSPTPDSPIARLRALGAEPGGELKALLAADGSPEQADGVRAEEERAVPSPAEGGPGESIRALLGADDGVTPIERPERLVVDEIPTGEAVPPVGREAEGEQQGVAQAPSLPAERPIDSGIERGVVPEQGVDQRKAARVQEIDAQLARLNATYKKKQASLGPMVPPSIRASALDGLTRQMDKLEAEKAKLEAPIASEAKPVAIQSQSVAKAEPKAAAPQPDTQPKEAPTPEQAATKEEPGIAAEPATATKEEVKASRGRALRNERASEMVKDNLSKLMSGRDRIYVGPQSRVTVDGAEVLVPTGPIMRALGATEDGLNYWKPPAKPSTAVEPADVTEVSTKPGTPEKAAEKVIDQVERVVDTEGAKSAKEVHERVLKALEEELEAVLKVSPFKKIEYRPGGTRSGKPVGSIVVDGHTEAETFANEVTWSKYSNRLEDVVDRPNIILDVRRDETTHSTVGRQARFAVANALAKDLGSIKLQIPGDGTFTINRNPEAIRETIARIKSGGTTPWKSVASYRKADPKSSPAPVDAKPEPVVEKAVEQPAAPAKEAPKAEPKTETKKALSDVGEHIGGSRKDRWAARGLMVGDLEGMSGGEQAQYVTKDNVWPKIDYAARIAEGMEPRAAALLKILRDRVATAPRTINNQMNAQARAEYVEVVGKLRDLTAKANTFAEVQALADDLSEALGIKAYRGRAAANLSDAEKVEARRLYEKLWQLYGSATHNPLFIRGSDIRKAEKLVATGWPKKVARATTVTADGETKKIEPARPHLDAIERTGEDVRNGRDVTAEAFREHFGFRGLEFGNWAANDERQKLVNLAFEALHDLANVMGIPPKAISMNGTLGLALAARGGGKFAAHYEPGKLVINMTKINGAGSLAHEWGHALDHYFGEQNRPDAYQGAARGVSGWYAKGTAKLGHLRAEVKDAFERVMETLFKKFQTKAEIIRDKELLLEKAQARLDEVSKMETTDNMSKNSKIAGLNFWNRQVDSIRKDLEKIRSEMADGARVATGRSDYEKQAELLSGKSEKGYWLRPTEMFARAFEAFVFDRIRSDSRVSDYLVHGVEADRYADKKYKGNPYPTGTEREDIDAAFQNLVETIQTKETDKGVAMFERRPGAAPAFFSALGRAAEQMKQPMKGLDALAFLSKREGVKAAEIKWTGLDDFLRPKARVTPAEVQEFLKANAVTVTEVTKQDLESPAIARFLAKYDQVKPTKFSQYQEPGGKNYREVLLTLPMVDKFFVSDSADGFKVFMARADGTREVLSVEPTRAKAQAMADRLTQDNRKEVSGAFRSSHFDEPNILAHVRMNERTDSEGRKVLFLEEIQSDFGQATRRQQAAVSKFVDERFARVVFRMKEAGVLSVDCS